MAGVGTQGMMPPAGSKAAPSCYSTVASPAVVGAPRWRHAGALGRVVRICRTTVEGLQYRH